MKSFEALPLWFTVLLALSNSAGAGVFSVNVVGYVNLRISAGENLIANQLWATNNTLNGLFGSGTPEGATATKWDPTTQQFLAQSIYTSGSGWSINYDLRAGEGALFNSSSAFTNTFVGEVREFDGQSVVLTYPTLDAGTYLVSCSAPVQAGFSYIIGRNAFENESVRILDVTNQSYYTTTFRENGWDNGIPSLRVGESAFFTIVSPTAAVPEPTTISLLACGIIAFGVGRVAIRRKKSSQKN